MPFARDFEKLAGTETSTVKEIGADVQNLSTYSNRTFL
jgi:hypothetical protein